MNNNKPYNKNNSKTQKEECTALVKEFAGMVACKSPEWDHK